MLSVAGSEVPFTNVALLYELRAMNTREDAETSKRQSEEGRMTMRQEIAPIAVRPSTLNGIRAVRPHAAFMELMFSISNGGLR